VSNTIRDGIVHDTIDVDFSHPWGTDHVFQDIELTSNVRVDALQHCDIAQIFGTAGVTISTGIIYQRLYVHDSDTNIMYSNGGDEFTIGNWTFRNNIFVNLTGEQRISIPNVKLYNNLYLNTGTDNTSPLQFGGNLTGGDYSNAGLDIQNNIILSDGVQMWTESNQGIAAYTHNNNYYGKLDYTQNATYGKSPTGQNTAITEATMVDGGDPKFTNLAIKDFTIQLDSPLKDVAAVIATFNTDKLGKARPFGLAWDIGPYEYTTGTTYNLIVAAPTNGTITSADGYINCGTGGIACSYSYTSGDNSVLTITPDSDYRIINTGGSCSGARGSQTVAMTEARTCTATFEKGMVLGTGNTLTIGTGNTITLQ